MRILNEKPCLFCGTTMKQSYNCSEKEWNERKRFCSRECSVKFTFYVKKTHKTQFVPGHIPPLKGKKMSEEGKKNLITWSKGNVPWNKGKKGVMPEPWNKGKHGYELKEFHRKPLKSRIRSCKKYRDWRTSVYKRDDYTCVMCGQRGYELEADHILGFASILSKYNITSIYEANICEELWDISNGRTLCKKCHKTTDNYAWKANIKNLA